MEAVCSFLFLWKVSSKSYKDLRTEENAGVERDGAPAFFSAPKSLLYSPPVPNQDSFLFSCDSY